MGEKIIKPFQNPTKQKDRHRAQAADQGRLGKHPTDAFILRLELVEQMLDQSQTARLALDLLVLQSRPRDEQGAFLLLKTKNWMQKSPTSVNMAISVGKWWNWAKEAAASCESIDFRLKFE